MQIEVGKRFTITMPGGDISSSGIYQITRMLASDKLWKELNPDSTLEYLPPLPSDWAWRWIADHLYNNVKYTGAFPRRVAKFYWVNYGLKLPSALVSNIGNVARDHTMSETDVTFDFVTDIDWESGDFGDDGSCYWGSQTGSRLMVEANGLAMRFFYAPDSDHGIARAWLAALPDRYHDVNYYVVFNGYGFGGDPTLRIAQILARFVEGEYRQVRIVNTDLSINGGYVGYAVGKPDQLPAHHGAVDFGWETISVSICYNCGDVISEGDEYYAPDDETYCDYCFHELFTTCSRCGRTHDNEYTTYIEAEEQDVCSNCLDRYYSECEDCYTHFPKQEGVRYCENCAENHGEADDDDPPDENADTDANADANAGVTEETTE